MSSNVLRFIQTRLANRAPDFVIGEPDDPYLLRWWIIPRNRWLNVYLHNIRRPDEDRALHDHPWWNLSWLLEGRYVEVMPCRCGGRKCPSVMRRGRDAGALILRRARAAHRLELDKAYVASFGRGAGEAAKREIVYRAAWTLFITGPRTREWGFHCPQGWAPWQDFVSKTASGSVGRGCGETK